MGASSLGSSVSRLLKRVDRRGVLLSGPGLAESEALCLDVFTACAAFSLAVLAAFGLIAILLGPGPAFQDPRCPRLLPVIVLEPALLRAFFVARPVLFTNESLPESKKD